MTNHWQFSLATLLLSTSGIAVVCAVLPYPYAAFYALVAFFFLAAVLARFGPADARGFWFWFSLCGWIYVVLGASLLEAVETTAFWHWTRDWLLVNSPAPYNWTPEHYLILAHAFLAIGIALIGAILVPLLRGSRRPNSTNKTSDSAPEAKP